MAARTFGVTFEIVGEIATALATCLAVPLGGVAARTVVVAKLMAATPIPRGRNTRMESS